MPLIEQLVQESLYLGIINGHIQPVEAAYNAGWQAHLDGEGFHMWKAYNKDMFSADALSWRIGWNGRALSERN